MHTPLRQYLKRQVLEAKVQVNLRTEVTPGLVQRERPDVVIIATGASPRRPESIAAGKKLLTAWDVLSGKESPRNKKVIVVGGGMVGAETADYLVQYGNKVTVVARRPTMAYDMEVHNRHALLKSLSKAGVTMLTGKEVQKVAEGGVVAIDKESGEKSFIEGDVVVFALGAAPNRELAEALEGKVPELYTIGDCNEPRIMMEAIYEGSKIGRVI